MAAFAHDRLYLPWVCGFIKEYPLFPIKEFLSQNLLLHPGLVFVEKT